MTPSYVDGTLTHAHLCRGGQVVGVPDPAGRLEQRFVYGFRPHVPDTMVVLDEDASHGWYRTETDHVGSFRRLVDAATGVVG